MVLEGFVPFLLDQLFPERCIACGAQVVSPSSPPTIVPSPPWPAHALAFFGSDLSLRLFPGIRVTARVLCTECWLRLEPARPAVCYRGDNGEGKCAHGRMEANARRPIPLISPFFANDPLLEVVRYLKFSGGRRAAVPLSWWMALALREHLSPAHVKDRRMTIVTAVPLHPARMRRRGYNQAALLAMHTARRVGLAFSGHLVSRTRNTPYQSHLPEAMRAANVRGAFRLNGDADIEGRRIVLVDDLVTTGETVAACVGALRTGGPAAVAVLAAGRPRREGRWDTDERGARRDVP